MDKKKGSKKGAEKGAKKRSRNGTKAGANWDANAKKLYERGEFIGGSRMRYRKEVREWVVKNNPNLWVTVSFKHPRNAAHRDFITATKWLDRFLNRVCKKAWGAARLREGVQRPSVYGFLEHVHTNLHYNLLICCDLRFENAMLIYGDATLRKVSPAHRGFELEAISSVEAVVSYVNKEQLTLGDYGTAYFYPPPDKPDV